MSKAAHQPVVIAEAGVNHNGERELAFELVDAAVKAGADMVKFQAFSAATLTSAAAPAAGYQSDRTGHESQQAMLQSLELDRDDFIAVAAHCQSRGIDFLCTPFDIGMLDFLIGLGMPALKIASGELTNTPALERFGAKTLPIYLSTGMATLDEVRGALATLREAGARDITVLHCTSLYPAPPETLNLTAIVTMREALGVPTGYSDHSEGIFAAVAATALGATVIEKHLTLDREMEGPDHAASLEPDELARMIAMIRAVAAARGDGIKQPVAAEAETALVARRSWHASRALPAGTTLGAQDVTALRPETGIPTNVAVTGRVLARDLAAGEALKEDDLVP